MKCSDLILYNGNIVTLDERFPRVTALAIRGGRVFACGSDDDMLALADAGTTRANLGGKTVIPGLTDAHIHWEGTARFLHKVNVFEVPDKSVAVQRVSERVAK